MKGISVPTYHLGTDFFHDDDGTLCLGAQTYSKRLVDSFERLYGEPPKTMFSPLDPDDHPELDDSPLCGPNGKCTKDTFKGSLFGCQENVSNTTLTIV